MLDIGGNIGIYPSYLGRFGYSILSFEPSPINYYISNKNYCNYRNKSNVILINKGLSNEEKTCNYYLNIGNKGNGIILCNDFINKEIKSQFLKESNVIITKFSNFIPYLLNKYLALMKIDIEGNEGKVIESGIDLINKYHIPYIFLEFSPLLLKEHGTDPRNFLLLFLDNGYKISLDGFFSNNYISIEQLITQYKKQAKIYLIYIGN